MSAPTAPAPPGPETGRIPLVRPARRGRARGAVRTLTWMLSTFATVVAVVAVLGLAVGPRVAPYRTATMLTGSMSPLIDPGDVIVVVPVPVAEVAPGMILTFQAPPPDGRVVTHRVVSVEPTATGAVAVRTKGDANAEVDPWVAVLEGDTAWRLRRVVPELGSAIRFLRAPTVHAALLWGLPAVLAGWGLVSLWRPTRREGAR